MTRRSPMGAAIAHTAGMAMRVLSPMPLILALAACAGVPAPVPADDSTGGATFIVVRHAEKADDAARDPDLSAAGQERALDLARQLAREDLVAVHATAFRRTQQTVQPTADAHGIPPATYDAGQPAEAFAARLRAEHPRGTVLVAGHSNTVPGIVAALCGCPVEEMPETEYDRLSTVRFDAGGRPRLEVTRYGAPTQAPAGP